MGQKGAARKKEAMFSELVYTMAEGVHQTVSARAKSGMRETRQRNLVRSAGVHQHVAGMWPVVYTRQCARRAMRNARYVGLVYTVTGLLR